MRSAAGIQPVKLGCAICDANFGTFSGFFGTDFTCNMGHVGLWDSIRISAPFLPHPFPSTLILRLRSVDTPEVGWCATCSEQSQFATNNELQQRTTRIQLDRWDKYGGRVLGDVLYIATSDRLVVGSGFGPALGRARSV